MGNWTNEALDRLGAADEIDIDPAPADDTPRRPTTIWIVRVDGCLYVRSYRGPSGGWYRTAVRMRRGRVSVGSIEYGIKLESATDVDRSAVDAAYRAKYGRSSYVDAMVADAAAATTLRLTPRIRPPGGSMTDTNEQRQPSGAERMFGDFAPALVRLTDDVLFGEVWNRSELSAKQRSLVTVAALTALGNTDQLVFHFDFAKQNGNTEDELIEAITHLAFYAGWPKAMAAMTVAQRVFRGDTD